MDHTGWKNCAEDGFRSAIIKFQKVFSKLPNHYTQKSGYNPYEHWFIPSLKILVSWYIVNTNTNHQC